MLISLTKHTEHSLEVSHCFHEGTVPGYVAWSVATKAGSHFWDCACGFGSGVNMMVDCVEVWI